VRGPGDRLLPAAVKSTPARCRRARSPGIIPGGLGEQAGQGDSRTRRLAHQMTPSCQAQAASHSRKTLTLLGYPGAACEWVAGSGGPCLRRESVDVFVCIWPISAGAECGSTGIRESDRRVCYLRTRTRPTP
jgi:hypothetical protein